MICALRCGVIVFPYVLLPVTAAGCAMLGDSEEMRCGDACCYVVLHIAGYEPLTSALCVDSIWTNFGCFFESFFWVSAFAVPSLLYRVNAVRIISLQFGNDNTGVCLARTDAFLFLACAIQINSSQLWWLLSSDALVFASFVGLAWLSNSD